MIYVIFLITVAIGVARFIVPVSGELNTADIYKDLAHLWVGFLFGWFAANLKIWNTSRIDVPWSGRILLMAIGLTVLEVIAFFVCRKT